MNTNILKTKKIGLFCVFTLLAIAVQAFNVVSLRNDDYLKRVENLNTVIELRITEEVTEQIDLMVFRRKRESEVILGRTSLYFPVIENLLRERNLPDELKYIAVIESALKPSAVSRQGATGLWQFMRGTALLFGMTIDKTIDERRDVYISTEKALDYLTLLYEKYGDWTLALAAYNCGTGNVAKAINKAGGETNYWKIRKYLPKETQYYIPKFIAASYMMTYYHIHQLTPTTPPDEIKMVSSVKVFDKIHFKELSKEFDLSLETIQLLNPMFLKDHIPASKDGQYYLTLPESKMFSFIDKYSAPEYLVYLPGNYNFGRFNSSDSHNMIASASFLDNRILMIRDKFKTADFIDQMKSSMVYSSSESKFYKLGRKESLSDAARVNNMTLDELMKLNNFTEEVLINPGSIIRI
jgi:hypothetical protein